MQRVTLLDMASARTPRCFDPSAPRAVPRWATIIACIEQVLRIIDDDDDFEDDLWTTSATTHSSSSSRSPDDRNHPSRQGERN